MRAAVRRAGRTFRERFGPYGYRQPCGRTRVKFQTILILYSLILYSVNSTAGASIRKPAGDSGFVLIVNRGRRGQSRDSDRWRNGQGQHPGHER